MVSLAATDEGTAPSAARWVGNLVDGIEGLAAIRPEHAAVFAAAAEAAEARAWAAAYPFLLASSRSGRRILWEQVADSLVVYQVRAGNDGPQLGLFLPPMPYSADALTRADERMATVNQDQQRQIEWIEESVALNVMRAGYSIRLRESEAIYDRAAAVAVEGPGYAPLASRLTAAGQHLDLVLRPYAPDDRAACADLLERTRARLRKSGTRAVGARQVRRLLEIAPDIPPDRLRGEVAEIAGSLRGFAFGGPISGAMGSIFTVMTDDEVDGLPHLLRHRMLAAFPDLPYFNDSSGDGRADLEEIIQCFAPVEMQAVYRGRA
jgi:hypothetical protein